LSVVALAPRDVVTYAIVNLPVSLPNKLMRFIMTTGYVILYLVIAWHQNFLMSCLGLEQTTQFRQNRCESVELLVAHRTNHRKVVGSRPAKVVCITVSVLTGNRLG